MVKMIKPDNMFSDTIYKQRINKHITVQWPTYMHPASPWYLDASEKFDLIFFKDSNDKHSKPQLPA